MAQLIIKNKIILFDDDDAINISQYKWKLVKNYNYGFYVKADFINPINGKKSLLSMHRLIMLVNDPKIEVDHKNRNTLDNRRVNLRVCNRTQNTINRAASGVSKYLGVYFLLNKRELKSGIKYYSKWRAAINVKGTKIYLGNYNNEIDAAIAYNVAAKKYHGEFANLNTFN